ncbi:MAG: hypothetical protein MUE44_12120 [Oscillatoriaceae cyanobacterium Prado104]|nr:hypothetical protein [Oscillatoriaceae cyanobacterium Prado104]
MSVQNISRAQTVTVVLNSDGPPASRFQVVICGAPNTEPRPIHTCATQGDVTSWLICNAYKWVENSEPQQWTKS